MTEPVRFDTFEEWADAHNLSPAERAAQARIGATVGQRFDTGDMRRQFAERAVVRAFRARRAADAAWTAVNDHDRADNQVETAQVDQLAAVDSSVDGAKRARGHQADYRPERDAS